MPFRVVHKASWPGGVVPNVLDYDAALATFSWDEARRSLDGLPGGRGLNIAHEAVDRHAAGPRGQVALRWIRRDGRAEATYAELRASTNRSPTSSRDLGVGQGDRVFSLLGRLPELYIGGARHAEAHQRVLPAVLRVRTGADPPAARQG